MYAVLCRCCNCLQISYTYCSPPPQILAPTTLIIDIGSSYHTHINTHIVASIDVYEIVITYTSIDYYHLIILRLIHAVLMINEPHGQHCPISRIVPMIINRANWLNRFIGRYVTFTIIHTNIAHHMRRNPLIWCN